MTEVSRQNGVFFMEAMKTRFLPVTEKIHKILDEHSLGKINYIENRFMFRMPYDREKYHFDPIQGGALYDTGMYNISMILDYVKDDLADIDLKYRIKYGVDVYDETTLTFKNGTTAKMYNSMDSDTNRSMLIQCEKGSIEAAPFYRPEKIIMTSSNGKRELNFPMEYDDFYWEIRAAHDCINRKKIEHPRYSHKDMIQGISLMETIKKKMHP